MQIGSLVTPNKDLSGTWETSEGVKNLHRSLVKGEILTISSIEQAHHQGVTVTGLMFAELPEKFHPDSGKTLLWWDKYFDELQPPMSISDELFSHAPETCEA